MREGYVSHGTLCPPQRWPDTEDDEDMALDAGPADAEVAADLLAVVTRVASRRALSDELATRAP